MIQLETQLPTDTWVTATWDEYIQSLENPTYQKAKSYYYNQKLRIEMTPVGNDHACDHGNVLVAVSLFCTVKNIPNTVRDNCTYRQTDLREAQPDISFYIAENAEVISWGTSIIDLDIYPPPDLVIEVANTSLADDKGEKRLLYEDLNVKEYWIVDVQNVQMIAFAIADGGSKRIQESQVLPGLKLSLLNEVLQQSRQTNQGSVIRWLLTQFQQG